jgi:hypothetical protein
VILLESVAATVSKGRRVVIARSRDLASLERLIRRSLGQPTQSARAAFTFAE